MPLPAHKTKIVATIGPASESPDMIERLIRAGMNVARLNFSHGEFQSHRDRIRVLRDAERRTGTRIAIMADLPGPKMRIGRIDPEPIHLTAGDPFTLTVEETVGDRHRVSVSFENLARVVKPGDSLFLNDGQVQLRVETAAHPEVHCRVVVGGELSSRKGLNLPGIHLGIGAFTPHDRDCLAFALENGVDAISQSFVETAADIEAVRHAARDLGHQPFILAKIERAGALRHVDAILAAADGIMVARGDLGVEVPIEQIAVTQKELVARANLAGKPVITATQMLESMVSSRIPTRAEATDVANAILDGTDAVMLSAESAVGRFPVESISMLARIAAVTEARRPADPLRRWPDVRLDACESPGGGFSRVVEEALGSLPCAMALVPTKTGATARLISRFKPAVWIIALAQNAGVAQALHFSYGVHPVFHPEEPESWRALATRWKHEHGLAGEFALLVAGPSARHPEANHRLEFLPLPAT